jgi:hypothetical protein
VIQFSFRAPGAWTFWDFQYTEESNPIEDWYNNSLSEEARSEFDALLKVLRRTESHLQWLGFRGFLHGKKLQEERVWELGFRADNRSYRILGKFGDTRRQAIILVGCYHKSRVYTPVDALEQAYKRSRLLAERRAMICERPVNKDI